MSTQQETIERTAPLNVVDRARLHEAANEERRRIVAEQAERWSLNMRLNQAALDRE